MNTAGSTYDAIVVGAGVMGAAAAYELARRGSRVALLEQARLPNPRAASTDYSKVFRFAYPEKLYVQMATASLLLWREWEARLGLELLTPAGLLLVGSDASEFEAKSYEALRALQLDVERLDRATLQARYPQFDATAVTQAVYDPSGAITHAEKAVLALLQAARDLGAEVLENERMTMIETASSAGAKTTKVCSASGGVWQSEKVLIAAGPWTRKLLPELAAQLTTTRQEVVYFKPRARRESFEVGRLPIFLDMESGFYGFPIHHHESVKVGNHHKGAVMDTDTSDERVGEAFIEKCRVFFARLLPALADAEVVETRICFYNNTPDDDFIIDWHPQFDGVLLATGFSGHGFKFAPLIGRLAADLLLEGKSDFSHDRFRLARLFGVKRLADEEVKR